MQKAINQIELAAAPPALDQCFSLLREADPEAPFALFGGVIRDTDYAAYHGEPRPVNDYDLRVWLPEDDHEARMQEFVAHLGAAAGTAIRETPSAGTGRIRYCLNYHGAEMDVSVRPPVTSSLAVATVAIERAKDIDIGLSSVAIASDGSAWATPEYVADRNNRTLTVYPRPNAERRLREYTEHMQKKFPDHTVIRLPGVSF